MLFPTENNAKVLQKNGRRYFYEFTYLIITDNDHRQKIKTLFLRNFCNKAE